MCFWLLALSEQVEQFHFSAHGLVCVACTRFLSLSWSWSLLRLIARSIEIRLVSSNAAVAMVAVISGAAGATFTFVNSCAFTVWVGLQPNGGIPLLAGGGFELDAGSQNAVIAPAAWGGRFWGRTGEREGGREENFGA